MSRLLSLLIVLAAVAAGTGCGRRMETAGHERPLPVVGGVDTEVVALQAVAESFEAVGTVRSRKQTVVSARIVAPVMAVHVREGDRVKAGQLLIELDDRDVKSQLVRAEAGLLEAQEAMGEADAAIVAAHKTVTAAEAQKELVSLTFKRHEALLDKRSVTRQEYDEARAKLVAAGAEVERATAVHASLLAKKRQAQAKAAQAEAGVANAKLLAGYASLLAPIDGLVSSRSAEVGNLAAPGIGLVTVDSEQYRLEAQVQESEFGRVTLADRVTVVLDALGKQLEGPVVEIVPSSDPASRTSIVKIDLGAQTGMRPGLFGKARFAGGRTQTLTVPRSAVVERGQIEAVFALDAGGVARLRLIKTGKTRGDRVEVLAGLDPGETIAVKGVEKLTDPCRIEGTATTGGRR
ncbi:MAG: efflux RND transporter periplasmic adaptor subunit [Candidatus Riflebacteria bacterium]|nr:efflux RND transporter periplasmic adaptor subunit [Candidatus Riflebacteria bacterium]